jgi:hypothetical protein
MSQKKQGIHIFPLFNITFIYILIVNNTIQVIVPLICHKIGFIISSLLKYKDEESTFFILIFTNRL